MIRFSKDELLSLRQPTRLSPEMAQIPHVISQEALEPSSKPLDADEVERHWGRVKGEGRIIAQACFFGERGLKFLVQSARNREPADKPWFCEELS